MGRCSGWIKGLALLVVALMMGCGNTDSKSSSTGKPFVFQARARLNLTVQVDPTDPKLLYLTATLLDPQGNPMPDQRITFVAEFPDAIFIPPDLTDPSACLNPGTAATTLCSNRGAAVTDSNGQAKATLFAIIGQNGAPRNPDRLMRVVAVAPISLNIASAISVPFTAIGFRIGGALSITPPSATLVNPLIQPGTDGPTVTFTVQGGRPPYKWDNQNKNLGKLTPTTPPSDLSQQFVYTVIGAIPTTTADVLTDTITVTDAAGATITATVTIIFADCELDANGRTITFNAAVGGETFSVRVSDGVPPFTVTEDFPGTIALGSPQTQCNNSQQDCSLLFTLATPARRVSPNNILIRDSRGCTAQVDLTVTPRCGNGTLEAREECDGTNVRGLTCANILQDTTAVGTLLCNSTDCTIDDTFCRVPAAAPLCGNGALNPGEVCDGTNFQGVTCADILGNSAAVGTLRCAADCLSINSGFCRAPAAAPLCGNNAIDAGEECDGTNVRGVTCADILGNSAATGPLLCDPANCTFNPQFCQSPIPPATILATASPTQVCRTTGGNSTISVLALDNTNKAFAGAGLLFSSTAGTLSSPNATTGTNGRASVTLTIPAGTAPGVITVSVASGAATGNATVTVLAAGNPPTCP